MHEPESPVSGADPITATLRRCGTGIESLEELRVHLQWAIDLEHATIPAYLHALYSLVPGTNHDAAEVLHSVVLEEMLHLAVTCNLLNAVGGAPELDCPRLLPGHPRLLPHREPPLQIPLLPFGRDALAVFLAIESPCDPDAPTYRDRYATIAQFYGAIRAGLVDLCAELGESAVFTGDPDRQVSDPRFCGALGRVFEVTGLASAMTAVDLIVEQGEGVAHVDVWDGDRDMFHPERRAVGHYYRFRQLELGRRYRSGDTPDTGPTGEPVRVDWEAVHPVRPNGRSADHLDDSPARLAIDGFNRTYVALLRGLERTFDGRPAELGGAIATMFELKQRAADLTAVPLGDGSECVGPSFEYVEPPGRDRGLRPGVYPG